MRDATAAIVSGEEETRMAEVAHQLDHVLCHCAFRICRVLRIAWRLRRIAVAAKIRAHDGIPMCESRRDLVPDHVRLWIAVQQQQRRSGAADSAANLGARRLNSQRRKTGE